MNRILWFEMITNSKLRYKHWALIRSFPLRWVLGVEKKYWICIAESLVSRAIKLVCQCPSSSPSSYESDIWLAKFKVIKCISLLGLFVFVCFYTRIGQIKSSVIGQLKKCNANVIINYYFTKPYRPKFLWKLYDSIIKFQNFI